MKKRLILLLLIVSACAIFIFINRAGWMKNSLLKFSGTLELTEHSLGARTSGRLTTLLVDEGDEVKAGQLLATLDRYEQAKHDYERAAKLLEQGGTTQQAVEQAKLTFDDESV